MNNHDFSMNLVLAGNPNVGKSVFFNALTGMYADVSNFPGTTVDVSKGKFLDYTVIDTPGVYGISSFNDEERVARDVIVDGDIIINVADAVHLQRDLFLTQQLIDMGKRVILCLNMMDETASNGITIDDRALERLLGIPVIKTSATSGVGIDALKTQIGRACAGNATPGLEIFTSSHLDVDDAALRVLLCEDDAHTLERFNKRSQASREKVYSIRRQHIDAIIHAVLRFDISAEGVSARLGGLMLSPKTGLPITLGILALVFLLLGVVIAQWVVGITQDYIMQGLYAPFVSDLVSGMIPRGSPMFELLAGEFGIFTLVPVYVLGLLFPLVMGFYLLVSILEDSGLLPRIAAITDRMFTAIGLNGRAVIPIILGFGCVTAATISTRILGSRRERIIATALLGLTIPCSAQIGIILSLLVPLGPIITIIYVCIMLLVFGIAGLCLDRLLPGQSTALLIDLPPIRVPHLNNIIKKTWSKVVAFLWDAAPLFLLGALIMSLLMITGLLEKLYAVMAPLTTGVLKLPSEASSVFVMGLIRRDFGAAGLAELPLSPMQILVAITVLTLFVPCIASVLIIFKERTKLEAAAIWIGSLVTAFAIGGIIALFI